MSGGFAFFDEGSFPTVDGKINVPEEPGLGIELHEEVVAQYHVG